MLESLCGSSIYSHSFIFCVESQTYHNEFCTFSHRLGLANLSGLKCFLHYGESNASKHSARGKRASELQKHFFIFAKCSLIVTLLDLICNLKLDCNSQQAIVYLKLLHLAAGAVVGNK